MLEKRSWLWRAVLLMGTITLSAIAVACATRPDSTLSNNTGSASRHWFRPSDDRRYPAAGPGRQPGDLEDRLAVLLGGRDSLHRCAN